MTDRDIELDQIERELKGDQVPYIEKPVAPITDGTSCFLDQNRACGPDCRAYDNGVVPAQTGEVCVLLSSVMDISDGLRPLIDLMMGTKKAKQDREREKAGSIPVPDPRGRVR